MQHHIPAIGLGLVLAFVEIAAGATHGLARLDDGSVLAWGDNRFGQCDVPALPAGTTYERISAGGAGFEVFDDCVFVPPFYLYDWGASGFSVALRSDGAVVGWGSNDMYQVLDPWTDLGGGTSGVAGVPQLSGKSTPVEGAFVGLTLTGAPPFAPVLGWIALAPTPFAALGGTVHAWPYTAQVPLLSNLIGNLALGATWPAGIPTGSEVTFQFVIQDLSVPAGITLSDAVRVIAFGR